MKRIGIILAIIAGIGLKTSLHARLEPEFVKFEVKVIGGRGDQRFVIAIPASKTALIARAREKIKSKDHRQVVIGELAFGNASYNKKWSWHIIPETVDLVDSATEVCDAEPLYVEENLDAWIKSTKNPMAVGYYCPWNAEIVAEIRGKAMPLKINPTKPEQAG